MSLLNDVNEWIDARGYENVVTDADVLRAKDYLKTLPWLDDYEPEWDDHSDWEEGIFSALCYAARMENEEPGILMPQTRQRIAREKVDVIEIQYESGGNQQIFPALLRYLKGYITSGNIITVRLA